VTYGGRRGCLFCLARRGSHGDSLALHSRGGSSCRHRAPRPRAHLCTRQHKWVSWRRYHSARIRARQAPASPRKRIKRRAARGGDLGFARASRCAANPRALPHRTRAHRPRLTVRSFKYIFARCEGGTPRRSENHSHALAAVKSCLSQHIRICTRSARAYKARCRHFASLSCATSRCSLASKLFLLRHSGCASKALLAQATNARWAAEVDEQNWRKMKDKQASNGEDVMKNWADG